MAGDTGVIHGLRQTEKAARLARHRQYVLRVATDATKVQIREAAQALFNVRVMSVNTQMCHGKWRRLTGRWGHRPDWKKAVITVAEGQKIDLK